MVAKNPFFELFGRSPIKPLQHHIEVVQRCALLTIDLFEAVFAGERDEVQKQINRIFEVESEADQVKNDLREHLPKSLLMPIDRRDLLEILNLQDAIADTAQDIAAIVQLRRFEVPVELQEPFRLLVRRSIDACNQCSTIINELDELVATGFRGRTSDVVHDMIAELNKIESDADKLGNDLSRELFRHDATMSPVSLMLTFRVVELIGGMADYAEMVGNRLRLVLAR